MGRQRGNRNRREEVQVGIYKTRIAFSSSLNWESSSKEVTEGRLIFSNIKLKKKIGNPLESEPLSGDWRGCPGWGRLEQAESVLPQTTCPLPSPPFDRQKGWEGERSSAFIFGPSSLKIPQPFLFDRSPF